MVGHCFAFSPKITASTPRRRPTRWYHVACILLLGRPSQGPRLTVPLPLSEGAVTILVIGVSDFSVLARVASGKRGEISELRLLSAVAEAIRGTPAERSASFVAGSCIGRRDSHCTLHRAVSCSPTLGTQTVREFEASRMCRQARMGRKRQRSLRATRDLPDTSPRDSISP
jgi:hypothetical protein